ncbi:FUSC family protein [Salinibacterium sp. dk2585]|uniref:FUSC family protein n=1 Tax=unclassified Salinibacterium TaxID=2632331 RepID=UPI0011C243D3|nr:MULTISPECIES: FUSC family protein [unclassified Salinibacterium]QEE61086.1 FUSC family protein [Salinibacterium sp. dk2585]TXK53029.1 FUSC family protein [Salinibacterium sp. dk5596]
MTSRVGLKRRLSRVIAPSIRPARLVLAFKTALAAGVAWPVGHLLPGVDEYSYYAPLGALIVMMPTLMSSLRSTLQTALGLLIGIGLAFAVIFSPLPGSLSVAIAVGLGVLLGGLGGLGAGRDYVPIAALFVLVLGGANADDFSLGYLVQMGVGMLVGVTINAAIMPPLWIQESSASVSGLRQRIAETLDDLALRVVDGSELHGSLDQVREIDSALREAESTAADAAESRRLNPRARRHHYDIDEDFDDLLALTRLASQLRHVIEDAQARRDCLEGASDPASATVELVLRRLADLLRAWDARRGAQDAVQEARDAIVRLAALERQHPLSLDGHEEPTLSPDARHMVAIVERRLHRT